VFSAPIPAWRNLFSERKGSSAVEGTSQAVLGSSNQQKVPVSLSVFLKSEKVPALLYLGKGPEYWPFHDFRPVGLPPQAQSQIMEGPSPIPKELIRNKGTRTVQSFLLKS
jgi:hypothetical protein